MKIILILALIIVASSNALAQYSKEIERKMKYDYVYDDCMEKNFDGEKSVIYDCLNAKIARWEEHLDSLVNVINENLEEYNFTKQKELFNKSHDAWKVFYENEKKFILAQTYELQEYMFEVSNENELVLEMLLDRCFNVEFQISFAKQNYESLMIMKNSVKHIEYYDE